jgi:hypothetical protein
MADMFVMQRLPGEKSPRSFVITSGDLAACPMKRMDVKHYNMDGSCKCPNMRTVWARKRDDIWERIEAVAQSKGLSGSYEVRGLFRRAKPGQVPKQWCARVRVAPKK